MISNDTVHWKFPQWTATCGVVLLMFQIGFMVGWSSPYLSRLVSPNSDLLITRMEASWIASLLNVGRFLGAFLGSVALHYGGSKKAVFCIFIPIALGWLLILEANCVEVLYISRLASGIGMGMTFNCFPLYVGEVSLPQTRGSMIMMAFSGSAFGSFLASVCGYYLTMRESSFVFLAPCVLGMIVFSLLPDSPYWLLKRGNVEAAKKSIDWYRSGIGVNEEFESVQKFITSIKSKNFMEKLKRFQNPPVRKALVIVFALFAYMQLSGLNSILFFMEIIFRTGKSHIIHPSVAVALVNLAGVLTIVLTINMMDKYGRRILLLISGSGVAISMTAMGMHFHLMDLGYDPINFEWLPVICAFAFLVFFTFGLLTVPSTILSEIFPANVKSTAACVASVIGATCAFVVSKSFVLITDFVGEQYAFFLYAGITFTIIPFVIFYVPETKGKTLQEIQETLNN